MALTQVQGQMLSGSSNTTTTIQSNGTTAITIDSSQNVGIGTASPAAKLDVGVSNGYLRSGVNGSDTNYNIRANSGSNCSITWTENGQADRWTVGCVASQGYLAFKYNSSNMGNGTEAMRIDSSGNVYMGATSTSASARINVVAGSQTCSYFSNTNTSDLFEVRGNNGNSSGSAMYVMPMRFGDSTLRGSIYWTGSAVQYNTSSDYRLKENIAPMTGALDKVALLKPCTYTWKATGETSQGFIAHELQEVVPECVTGEKDAVEEDGSIKPQGIDTSFLVATLTAAIQEQQAIITDLKARIETLEAK